MFESFNDFVNNEATDFNDPILMKMRAAQMKANKKAAEKAEKAKKELSPAKLKKIQALKDERAEVLKDMEQEGELEGGEIADMYGDMLNNIDNQIIKLGGNPLEESYDGNMSDFKYEFPNKFEDVTGNPVKAIKKISKKGKGFEVRTATYMSRPEMEEVGDAMGLIVTDYEKHSNIAITVYESVVTEGYGEFIKAKNLTDIVNLSKEKKRAVFYVTDDNNSRIGSFYLKNGKFAKATTANPSYDLQNNKTSLKDRSDVIYKYKIDESVVTEGKVQLKRRYTENHPAITAGKTARVRNKMLEAIADGKITQEEFDAILKEFSSDSKRWMKTNTKYFSVSEDGISLSTFGKRALGQITVNEDMENNKPFMFESFSDFSKSNKEELNEGYVKSKGYKLAEERIETLLSQLDPKSNLCKGISKAADNVVPEFTEMKKHMNEIASIWQDIEYTIEMSNESVVTEEVLCEATVEMDAMDPDNKDFLKFLKKNRVKIISKEMDGPGGGTPVITMQGKRKDLENVLADGEYGWDDADLAEYIEESVDTEMISEAFKSSKLRNLLNMDQSGSDRYGQKASKLAQGLYGISKIKLDEVEDADLIDLTPEAARKEASKSKEFIVFYIIDNEKENPYADENTYRKSILRPGILAVTRGKDFLGVTYDQHASRSAYDKRGGKTKYHMVPDKEGVGGNKNYRGYDASGIYNVKRAADLADRAIVFDMTMADKSAKELIQQRTDAQSGAIAFKSDKDFKKANMTRYKDILAQKASKLPLDKIVEDAINMLTKHISDGIKKGDKTKYGDLKLGEDKKGRDIKITDASNIMTSILSDYERYVSAVTNMEMEKDSGYSSGYYERSSKEYAKSISDRVKKVKNMDYAW